MEQNEVEDGGEAYWTITPNLSAAPPEEKRSKNYHQVSNKIKTTKYTIITFLPKNLFEQFHRFANVYFLFIVVLNWIPAINAFGKEIAMIPILFVLTVTAVKDLFEDRKRYLSDNRVNNLVCFVYDSTSGQFLSKTWKEMECGDIVQLKKNDIIPADILLLSTSDENGLCHVSTANLDGETNLKQKQSVKGLSEDYFVEKFVVKCEKPNNQIHSFYGFITKDEGGSYPVDKGNLLLRGCVVRNTELLEGVVIYAGHNTKAMLNNSGPRYKRSRLEKGINVDVMACVVILLFFCLIGAVGTGFWASNHELFDNNFSPDEDPKSPAFEGFIRFWTFIIILQVIIPVSLYVSVEIVKLGQVYFINNDIEMYADSPTKQSICRATNINEDLGQIQYIFSDKTGTLTENEMAFKRFSIAGQQFVKPESNEECLPMTTEVVLRNDTLSVNWSDFFLCLAICNSVVLPKKHRKRSKGFRREARSSIRDRARHKTALGDSDEDILQELGITEDPPSSANNSRQVSVESKSDGVVNQTYSPENGTTNHNGLHRALSSMYSSPTTVPEYEAESPDEAALVSASYLYGYQLMSRFPERCFVRSSEGGLVRYEVLNVLPFDSSRKRMSVIVKDPDDKITLYCKGADSVILSRLDDGQDELATSTEAHLQEFSEEGLRTLCVAKRDLSIDEYEAWLSNHKLSELSVKDRDTKVANSADIIEQKLTLVGATGIEDKLQEGVPETIASLRQAGLRVWVLTGDKQETAINIGFACKLLDHNMEIVTINVKTKEECLDVLETVTQRVKARQAISNQVYVTGSREAQAQNPLALVIDGQSLSFALEEPLDMKLLAIATECQSVVCCRAAPIQKARVVKLVRENLHAMCLAIGDGANDVSMLQVADVGVGLAGQEGMQAVMASDFVLCRFRFLRRLIVLHGQWCYDRIARMILYFFYKNAMFVFLLFWYQIFNGFSGSNAIDDVSLIFFNLVFTSLPAIVAGIWDQCLSADDILSRPYLYKRGQSGSTYTRKLFWANILDALYQSFALFIIVYIVYDDSDADFTVAGIVFHQIAVITVSAHLQIETPNTTCIHAVVLLGSIALSYCWFMAYNSIFVTTPVYFSFFNGAETANFWFITLLAPVIALAPRYLFRCFQSTFFPTAVQFIRRSAYWRTASSEQSMTNFGGVLPKSITSISSAEQESTVVA